jgi:hypothetical protein
MTPGHSAELQVLQIDSINWTSLLGRPSVAHGKEPNNQQHFRLNALQISLDTLSRIDEQI